MRLENELDYTTLSEKLNELAKRYENISFSYLGASVLGKSIPLITLGDRSATKSVLYVSTHHASENICTSVLLKFIEEYLNAYMRFGQICQINLRYLFKMRKIYIIPMLNPDGVDYRLNGLDDKNPLKDRILAYNGSDDFSKWNANARGVDLNHNYDAYFNEYKELEREREIMPGPTKYSGEYPESEPEVMALCNFIRYNSDELDGIITLHSQGEEIYFSSNGQIPERSKHLSKIISRMTGYKLSTPQDTASYGGLSDWFIKEFNKPSFTIECGKGINPLPISETTSIYAKLRELLFTFPILF
ncbi:MAG: M14 family metallocarboxypeptidase [Clostridia bacterium]|nr:M14 family metallocarboxypeptidase [Clostridia bacterium]MBQ7788972.1 M14 family metallocarboxypeptidase [Clostridia bacterium]